MLAKINSAALYGIDALRVEVEIDFLPQPECQTVVSGVGHIVREHRGSAAIHFDMECRPAPRATEPAARDVRP